MILNYYCYNVYNKSSEICVNPKTLIPNIIENVKDVVDRRLYDTINSKNAIYSEKDLNGIDYLEFINNVKDNNPFKC